MRFEIKESIDVFAPRRAVRTVAAEFGLPRDACAELAIVVSELCSNILKYGKRGSVEMEAVYEEGRLKGIAVMARDEGPPFADVAMALRDGYNDRGPVDPGTLLTRGGIGTGLGAVLRLTDSFRVDPDPRGKVIRVERWAKRPRRPPAP